MKLTKFVLLLLVLGLTLAACGGGESDAPTPVPTSAPAESADKPAEAAPTPAAESAEAEPAPPAQTIPTVRDIAQLLDLRTFARPADASELYDPATVGTLNLQTTLDVPAVAQFYRDELGKAGWQEDAAAGYADDTSAALFFTKDGYALSMSAVASGDSTSVTVLHHGNLDLAALPQTDDAEVIVPGPPLFMFTSAAGVADVARELRTELAAQGWREYSQPNSAAADDPNMQTRNFLQNGLSLSAYVATAPAQGGKTSVQYTVSVLPLDLPLSADADSVELNATQLYLKYKSAESIENLVEVVRQGMTGAGWSELPDSAALDNTTGSLLFFADEADKLALMAEILPAADGGGTTVTLSPGGSPGTLPTASESDSMPADSDTDQPAASSEMPAVPLPADAQDPVYDPDSAEIVFTSATKMADLVDFFRAELSALGWQEDTDFAVTSDTFSSIDFNQGDESITLTLIDFAGQVDGSLDLSSAPSLAGSPASGGTESADSGDSGDSAPPADAPTFTINDWPTPPEATEVKLSGETLSYKINTPLADVAEFYRPTFEQMELGTSCLDDVADYSSMSCSSSNGYVSLNFFAFEGFDNTEVEINFTNSYYPVEGGAVDGDSGELTAEDKDGLPVPSDNTGYSSESTEFSRKLTTTSPSDVATLTEFYQTELTALGWTEGDTTEADGATTVNYTGPDGVLGLTLKPAGDETEITLTAKNPAAAKEAGILPPAGQARLYLANMAGEPVTVTVDGQTIEVETDAGMDSPDNAPKLDIKPGSYQVTVKVGSATTSSEVTVGPDETWGLLLDAQGALPLQIY